MLNFYIKEVGMENIIKTAIQARRRIAAIEGEVRYIGTECGVCGSSERYVSNNNCFECTKKHAKAHDKRQRDLIRGIKKQRAG
tara:strand:+ start:245 stop:493 length:249 start_codon:yes stop_codon:yes gene_type:complete